MLRAAVAALLFATPAVSDQVTVFAAASLKAALDDIAADWEDRTGHDVVLSYAGTLQLAEQIAQGAPADLFLSASADWMNDLDSKSLIAEGSRRDLLGNTLVLVAHRRAEPAAIGPDLALLALLDGGRLAMACVDSVPAGINGREALTSLGLWDRVEPQVAQTENVRAALALVSSGEAPLGVVYGSDAVAARAAGKAVSVLGTFPEDSHLAIPYSVGLVAGCEHPAASGFLDWLSSPEAEAVFESQGFLVLD